MSGTTAILLDASRIRAQTSIKGAAVVEVAWDPTSPQEGVRRLRDALGASQQSSSIVLVIGLGFLEVARPELPPLDAQARRVLLLRDADRYFPIEGSVAVAWQDGFAFAMPERVLTVLVRAFEEFGRVDAVLALPQAIARASQNGAYDTDAAAGERGTITLREGAVRDVRRFAVAPTDDARDDTAAITTRALDVSSVLLAALSARFVPPTDQLLDTTTAATFERRRRGRLWRSAALLAASLFAIAWVANRLRDRELAEAQQQLAQLTADATPAQRAALRLDRAVTEQRLLASADSLNGSGTTPSAILARLGALLPKDAFVQRLEWDGSAWRIDGSATDTPRIVPLLDADPHFTEVRIVAASTRFLDAGKQRESFSIAFRTKSPTSGAQSGR